MGAFQKINIKVVYTYLLMYDDIVILVDYEKNNCGMVGSLVTLNGIPLDSCKSDHSLVVSNMYLLTL